MMIEFPALVILFLLSFKNGFTALEIAEMKSADEVATVIPEWPEYYRCEYKGGADYERVIQLLKGNLVEPATPPTYQVSNTMAH